MVGRDEWLKHYEASALRDDLLAETISGIALDAAYGPDDGLYPGQWPYTRGPYASMYRSKLWTMRMFAGFGTAADTNLRFKELLRAGGTGLSTAFDLPTLMGCDSDHPLARGEVGRSGVAIDSIDDVAQLFADIDLSTVTTSMTINSPAIILLAMYVAVARANGLTPAQLGGTIQNDILKEYQAQKEFIYPPRPSVRLVTDLVRYCTAEMPKWHTISISGYHIREAGSNAIQELAFTLANGFAYVEACSAAGLEVDAFARRFSFFFNAHVDFFEEIAKYHAARRIWARWLKDRYHASDERSMQLRFHAQTAGVSLTAQQPELNIARVAIQALAAVLGGTQSLHTDAFDEALALPTEKAARIALRTQQVIAEETGVALVGDPLGGSYLLESLTDEMEHTAEEIFSYLLDLGRGSMLEGVYSAIEDGWFQSEIAEASARYEREIRSKKRIIVGVNEYIEQDEDAEILYIGQHAEDEQIERLENLRKTRNGAAVEESLARLRADAARPESNVMPAVIEAVTARATLGEIITSFEQVFGTWSERAVV